MTVDVTEKPKPKRGRPRKYPEARTLQEMEKTLNDRIDDIEEMVTVLRVQMVAVRRAIQRR